MKPEIGKKYWYKLHDGRGRASIGEVIKTRATGVDMKASDGTTVKVPNDRIRSEYEYKPLNRQMARAPEVSGQNQNADTSGVSDLLNTLAAAVEAMKSNAQIINDVVTELNKPVVELIAHQRAA